MICYSKLVKFTHHGAKTKIPIENSLIYIYIYILNYFSNHLTPNFLYLVVNVSKTYAPRINKIKKQMYKNLNYNKMLNKRMWEA